MALTPGIAIKMRQGRHDHDNHEKEAPDWGLLSLSRLGPQGARLRSQRISSPQMDSSMVSRISGMPSKR